jgi:hypothetical protein
LLGFPATDVHSALRLNITIQSLSLVMQRSVLLSLRGSPPNFSITAEEHRRRSRTMITDYTKRIREKGIGAAVALTGALGLLAVGAGEAAAQSLVGSWAGGGTIIYPSGERERARCRATFHRSGGGGVSMHAVCATASARVIQNAALSQLTSSTYSGEFTNTEYGIQGSIRIKMHSSSKISASLNGGGGSAHFSLNR